MTTLVSAIRSRTDDRQLTESEIDAILRVADSKEQDEGVDASEVRQLLSAIDRTDHGMTPELRAKLRVDLQDMGWRSRAALELLERRTPSYTEAERVTEIKTIIQHLVSKAGRAQSSLNGTSYQLGRLADEAALAEGRLEPKSGNSFDEDWRELVGTLRGKRQHAAETMDRLRGYVDELPMADREIAFASIDSGSRSSLGRLTHLEEKLWIGASDQVRQSITTPLPKTGLDTPAEPAAGIAGMQFAEPVAWQFDAGTFQLPTGTRITRLPDSGDFHIRGEGVTLPNGTVIETGAARAVAGAITLDAGALVSSEGVLFRARKDDAQLRGSNHIMAAGPHIDLALVELDAATVLSPDATAELRVLRKQKIRFTIQEGRLPDGTDVRRGTGNAVALYEGERAVGVVAGSVQMNPGALLYTRPRAGDDNALVDCTGTRGELQRGAVVHKDGLIIGVQTNSRVRLDGAEFSVRLDGAEDVSPYRYGRDNTYVFGPGTTVHAFPETGVFTVAGNDIQFSLDGQSARLVSGKLLVTDGKITDVLPGSDVELEHGAVRTTTGRVRIAPNANLTEVGAANQVFLGARRVAAKGSGFVVSGTRHHDPLAGGEDPTFVSRRLRNELRLNGGSVEVEPRAGLLNRPDGVRVFGIQGNVDVVSGPLLWNSTKPRTAGTEKRGFGGAMMWIEQGDNLFELDPRPMYSTFDPATDSGRARELAPVMSERFLAADRATARAVAEGPTTIAGGDAASPAFVHAVQKSLEYFLGRRIPDTREMDAATEEAIRDFQRFNALEPTGVIDADTFSMLDEIAPALDRPMVQRIVSGPLAGEVARHVEGILNGTNRAISYRRGDANPKGPLVRVVQQQIGTQADGVMGSGTVSRLRAWQEEHGVLASGAIDAATLRKMVEATRTRTETVIQPRPKLMVMVAMNDDVPDELRRFRELAAHRGAEPVIIGPEDQPLQESRELARYLAMAESGAVDMDWLTITGHSTGSSTWGRLGRFEYSNFQDWKPTFPRAFAQVEKLNLMNCYNVTPERARNFWPSTFPNLQVAAGFMYSAPGKESQSSDEFLLNSGHIMADIEKGAELSQSPASSMARRFERDDYIKWQNAAIFFRTADNPDGVLGMTVTARREMENHGAEEELRAIPERFTTAFDNYFNAASEEHASPPSGHNSILRQYLGAVQHIVDRWEGRMQLYRQFVADEERFIESARAQYVAANGTDEGFERPSRDNYPTSLRARAEEYRRASGWENEYASIQELRAQILNLVKSHAIQNQFALFNAPTVHAFNRYVEESVANHNAANPDGEPLVAVRLPEPEEWGHMTRREMLLRLQAVEEGLGRLDYGTNRKAVYERDWVVMTERDPSQMEYTSPSGFLSYVGEFVRGLEPERIQPEWLDDSLLERDLATSARTRARMMPPAPVEDPAPAPLRTGSVPDHL